MTVTEATAALREEVKDRPWFYACFPVSAGGEHQILMLEHDFAPMLPRYRAYRGYPVARRIVRFPEEATT